MAGDGCPVSGRAVGTARAVGDDRVDAEADAQVDVLRLVDRPHVHPVAGPLAVARCTRGGCARSGCAGPAIDPSGSRPSRWRGETNCIR